MIVQFSTGGRGRDPAARGNALELRPDMASLSTGSVNFPTIVYENSATLVADLATKMKTFGVRPEIGSSILATCMEPSAWSRRGTSWMSDRMCKSSWA